MHSRRWNRKPLVAPRFIGSGDYGARGDRTSAVTTSRGGAWACAALAAIAAIAISSVCAVAGQEPGEPRALSEEAEQALLKELRSQMAQAQQFRTEGKPAEAIGAARQALELEKRLFPEPHPALADTLLWLSQAHQACGQWAEALQCGRQAVEIREATLGPEHPGYLASLSHLGLLYHAMGDHAKAEPVLRRALEVARAIHGPKHPDAIWCLNNLAELYQARGEYAEAEPLLREALEACREVRDRWPADYAVALNNLAGLYAEMGDYARAQPPLREALAIRKKVFGPESAEYAAGLNNLAGLCLEQGDFAQAESRLREALDIRRDVLGPRHPDCAVTLDNLAAACQSLDRPAEAETLYREAMAIREDVLGTGHPDYALSLNNLAALYRSIGDYQRAEPLYREALETRKKTLGTEHADYAVSLNNLAVLYRSMGDYGRAAPLYRQALDIQRRLLQETFAVLSERQQLEMTRSLRRTLDGYLSVTSSDADQERTYGYVLGWKGMVFVRQRQTRLAGDRPELAPLLDELQSTASGLAALVFSQPDPSQHDLWRKRVAGLSEKKERIEAELARRGAPFSTTQDELTTERLRAVIPAGTVLVDFLEYARSVPATGGSGTERGREEVAQPGATGVSPVHGQDARGTLEPTSKEYPAPLGRNEDQNAPQPSPTPHLAAFVVRPDRPLVRVELGPVAPIREAIDAWRDTYGQAAKGADAAKELHRRVWAPLEEHLGDLATVLVSPDGDLARFPLPALPGKKTGTYLLEERALAVVPVPQWLPELLAEPAESTGPTAAGSQRDAAEPSLLLLGDIDYDAPTRSTQEDGPAGLAATRHAAMHFDRLDSSRGEILAVRDSFELAHADGDVRLLRRHQATEAAFRREVPRHRFLHVATHGFFAPPEWSSLLEPADETGRSRTPRAAAPWQRSRLAALHPGLLSGLALAGANTPVQPGADDGILTAEEVASLDLGGVDLAVLSACETGLGPVAGGEGVLGLQRAFQVSGARTVVATLWKVSDEPTRQLMERFYENLWDRKMPKLEALRQAQLDMLREGPKRGMAIVRKEGEPEKPRRVPPYYWAAFVLSGDWR